MHGLSPHSVFINVGYGGYGLVVNVGMHRVSIVCKKRGCPRIIEIRDVDVKGRCPSFQFTAHTLATLCNCSVLTKECCEIQNYSLAQSTYIGSFST